MILSKEEILAKLNRRIETVHVEEFGGDVLFREMSIRERTEFNKRVFSEDADKVNAQNWAIALVANTVCDEVGNRVFTEEEMEQLWDQSEINLLILAECAKKVNGIASKSLQEEEKNSEKTTT